MRSSSPLLCLGWVVLTMFPTGRLAAEEVQRVEYRGQLVQQAVGGDSVPVRSFRVVAWIDGAGDARTSTFRIDDEGRGSLPWWRSIGRSNMGDPEPSPPQMRHVHLGRPYTLTLPGPIAATPPLQLDATFELPWDGRPTTFSVTGEQRLNNRDCWTVAGDSGNGRRQTWVIDKASHLVVRAAARVFIGQGERFELQLELVPGEDPAGDAVARELALATQLLDLRESLQLDDVATEELDAAQLKHVETALPSLATAAQQTDWERFVQSIAATAAASREQSMAIEKLAQRIVGQPAPEGTLTGLDGRPFDWRSPAGDVVVLHFWDYRGNPESPFGQVGYLDFLAGKLSGKPVRIYGIAVDERAADPEQRRSVQRDVRKFSTEFIRLGYPLAIDDGTLLKQFGDPRPLNTPLPLWIVIRKNGSVAHYHVGLYSIDAARGLEELQQQLNTLAAE